MKIKKNRSTIRLQDSQNLVLFSLSFRFVSKNILLEFIVKLTIPKQIEKLRVSTFLP